MLSHGSGTGAIPPFVPGCWTDSPGNTCVSLVSSDLCMFSTFTPRANSYVSPYVVVVLEMNHCVSHYPLSPCLSLPLCFCRCFFPYSWFIFITIVLVLLSYPPSLDSIPSRVLLWGNATIVYPCACRFICGRLDYHDHFWRQQILSTKFGRVAQLLWMLC